MKNSHNFIDLSGRQFGRLLVMARSGKKGPHVSWNCLCQCGNSTTVQGGNLKKGVSQSCGCLQKERVAARLTTHGMSKTPSYKNWRAMMRRCYEPTFKGYCNYGGRGIVVCDAWHLFATFFGDMGEAPARQTLERKDNDGPYSKDNCIWASRSVQSLNKRSNRLLTFNGETKPLVSWAKDLGIPRNALFQRLHRGWTTERALTQRIS